MITQAKLVAQHRPMYRAQLRHMIDYRLLGQANKELRLKCGPNSLWTRHTLRRAINRALPDITAPGAVTLANLAKKINQRSNELFGGRDITLKGKHLQKL
ncbi:MAG TPA: hypothetical protein VE863_02820 [Pyrinomonadaceae bacterium]|nr:hypothetical protein [Pyrinomonadaceae bacterium]